MELTRSVAAAAAAIFLWLGSAPIEAAQAPSVRDLARQVRISDPQLSPNGKTLAVIETRADLESDEFRSEIVLVEVSSGDIRPLTRERHHASYPRWSPSGDRIGFIAQDADKHGQLFVLPMNGGDALQLTKAKDGVSQFAWSPERLPRADHAVLRPVSRTDGQPRHGRVLCNPDGRTFPERPDSSDGRVPALDRLAAALSVVKRPDPPKSVPPGSSRAR